MRHPHAAAALAAALDAYRRAAVALEEHAGDPLRARAIAALDRAQLAAMKGSAIAAAELTRREARRQLHRAAEAAALAGVRLASAGARGRAVAHPKAGPSAPPPARTREARSDPTAGAGDAAAMLRAWREREGLTAGGAAAKVGATRSALSYWETGRKIPGAAMVAAIQRVTGIPARAWTVAKMRRLERGEAAGRR